MTGVVKWDECPSCGGDKDTRATACRACFMWDEEEVAFLTENIDAMSWKALAAALDRSARSVRQKCRNEGLQKDPEAARRAIRNGGRKAPVEERFWESVDKRGEGGCWVWTGTTDPNGYGLIGSGRRSLRAHRVSYRIHNGSIPEGKFVLHRCDNPPCVNPAHLFSGTQADNARDMWEKGRGVRGERHGVSKLTRRDVRQIRRLHASGGRTYKEIARELGGKVKPHAVGAVIRGETWGHV